MERRNCLVYFFFVSKQHTGNLGRKPTVGTEENVELVRGILERDKDLPTDAQNGWGRNQLGMKSASWNNITRRAACCNIVLKSECIKLIRIIICVVIDYF